MVTIPGDANRVLVGSIARTQLSCNNEYRCCDNDDGESHNGFIPGQQDSEEVSVDEGEPNQEFGYWIPELLGVPEFPQVHGELRQAENDGEDDEQIDRDVKGYRAEEKNSMGTKQIERSEYSRKQR